MLVAVPTTATFGEVPVGGRFSHRGESFVKATLNMAEDAKRNGTIFQNGTFVQLAEPVSPGVGFQARMM
jgi:hypothetical protein